MNKKSVSGVCRLPEFLKVHKEKPLFYTNSHMREAIIYPKDGYI
jgi:hypothetical protein